MAASQKPAAADETYPLNPSSPYLASKAGSDLLALSYFITIKTSILVTRASNNYGPISFLISNALETRTLPV